MGHEGRNHTNLNQHKDGFITMHGGLKNGVVRFSDYTVTEPVFRFVNSVSLLCMNLFE